MPNTLFLRLEGPLQAWGERGHWAVRDTASEPTKSGIVGLLACALGWNQDADLRHLSQQVQLGVRCDQPGQILTDYHTVSGGVMSAKGKIKENVNTHQPETVVSWRAYLCDASFLAAVQSDSEFITQLAEAVQSPYWPLYLGRKSCVPSCPVFEGTGDYPSLAAALEAWPWYQPDGKLETMMRRRAVVESQPGTGIRRRDELISRSRRTFGLRYTQDIEVTVTIRPDLPGF